MLDEAFASAPQGWPNQSGGTAWYADGAYRLQTREAGQFIVLNAPLTGIVNDVVVSARFHKTGGAMGGGYGLVVADQGPDLHNGVNQRGRFVALEAGDQGTIGAWEREEDRWIDLQPWIPSAAVHEGTAVNELMVRVEGQQLTFLVNGTQVAQVTTKLVAGRVGVFVGGDGNEVALEHFMVQSTTSTTPNTSRAPATATPRSTVTPRPVHVATAAPTPVVDAFLSQLDAAWAQGDWLTALSLLDRIEQLAPTALDFQAKRYAAHMAAGQALLGKGNPLGAAEQFANAQVIDPSRREATAALIALTPTPIPAPTRPSPTAGSGVSPIGEILPPGEVAANAVYSIPTPWDGPVEVSNVQRGPTGLIVSVLLDSKRYVYAYSCGSGRCKGFSTDVWRALPRAQQRAYIDRLLDALHAALPGQTPGVRIVGHDGAGIITVTGQIVGGQRTYEGL